MHRLVAIVVTLNVLCIITDSLYELAKQTRQRAISKVVSVQCHVENMCVINYFYNYIVPNDS